MEARSVVKVYGLIGSLKPCGVTWMYRMMTGLPVKVQVGALLALRLGMVRTVT